MKLDNLDLSIVIPAYLEEENLKVILPELKTTLNSLNLAYEVLVVDTIEPLDNAKAACLENEVRYINREGGNFYGDAVKTGINQALGKKILFMDADGSHSSEFIAEMLKYKDSYDIVAASRYIEGGGTENSDLLILMSKILNITYSIVLGINCKDISNSFKLYDSGDLKGLSLYCNNFDIIEEIIYKISKKNRNLKIKEIPCIFKNRVFGKTKRELLPFIATYFHTMIKLRFGK